MATMKSVKPGGKVVTEAKLSKAFEVYSRQVVEAVKLIEDRQTEFETEVRKALLAVEDEMPHAVRREVVRIREEKDAIMAAEAAKRPWWKVWA